MDVWLVYEWGTDEYYVRGIFSSELKAISFIEKNFNVTKDGDGWKTDYGMYIDYQKYEVDEKTEENGKTKTD